MRLVEQHIIKSSHPNYQELDKLCFLSKNLYNSALYAIRQHFFETGNYLNVYELINRFTHEKQPDYKALPANVAQQVIMQADSNFSSFFGLLNKKREGKYTEKVKIPKYLNKDGRYLLTYTTCALLKSDLEKGLITLRKWKKPLENVKTKQRNIQQVRINPKNGYILIDVIYKIKEKELKTDNQRYMSIDLGVNNLAACSSNVCKPFIINGKPLKSINQYWNKIDSEINSELETVNKSKTSKKKQRLILKRKNKIKDYFHKTSRIIVNYAVSNNLNTIVIGRNKMWKQDINNGKVNNQNFVQIPFNILIRSISYKAELEGIEVIVREESYTSQASFLDGDFIPTYGKNDKDGKFSGKRIKRGLYRSKSGRLLNADVHASLNILRKEFPNAFTDMGLEVCSTPTIVDIPQVKKHCRCLNTMDIKEN